MSQSEDFLLINLNQLHTNHHWTQAYNIHARTSSMTLSFVVTINLVHAFLNSVNTKPHFSPFTALFTCPRTIKHVALTVDLITCTKLHLMSATVYHPISISIWTLQTGFGKCSLLRPSPSPIPTRMSSIYPYPITTPLVGTCLRYVTTATKMMLHVSVKSSTSAYRENRQTSDDLQQTCDERSMKQSCDLFIFS